MILGSPFSHTVSAVGDYLPDDLEDFTDVESATPSEPLLFPSSSPSLAVSNEPSVFPTTTHPSFPPPTTKPTMVVPTVQPTATQSMVPSLAETQVATQVESEETVGSSEEEFTAEETTNEKPKDESREVPPEETEPKDETTEREVPTDSTQDDETPTTLLAAQLERLLVTFTVRPSRLRRLEVAREQVLVEALETHLVRYIVPAQSASIYLTRVSSPTSSVLVETFALSGTLWYQPNPDKTWDLRPPAVRDAVSTTLKPPLVQHLVRELRTLDSNYWQRIDTVNLGLAATPSESSTTTTTTPTTSETTPWYEKAWNTAKDQPDEFEWDDPIHLILFAGCVAAIAACCILVGVCCCCRCRSMDSLSSVTSEKAVLRPDATDEVEDESSAPNDDDEERSVMPSDTTSVYSYIDTTTLDGQSIDTASILHRQDTGDDGSRRSVLWSVMDGITSDAAGVMKTASGSPSRMVVQTNGLMIFSDEEHDDLSLVSTPNERPVAMDSSPTPPGSLHRRTVQPEQEQPPSINEEALYEQTTPNDEMSVGGSLSCVEEASTQAEDSTQMSACESATLGSVVSVPMDASLASYLDHKPKYPADDGSLISRTFTDEELDLLGLTEEAPTMLSLPRAYVQTTSTR